MKVCHTVICFVFLTLRDANTGLLSAGKRIITEKEGGYIRHACNFKLSGQRRLFCKEDCEEKKNILIDTTEDRDENGRYSIEYTTGEGLLSSAVLYVIIKNLTKSDSGNYRCSLDRSWLPDGTKDFQLEVEDAPVPSRPELTPQSFPTLSSSTFSTIPSASTLLTTTATTTAPQSLSSSSGNSTTLSASTVTTDQSSQQPTTQGPDQKSSGVLLCVGLALVVMVIMLSVAMLILCRKRTRKPREPTMEIEYEDVAENKVVYEEAREDRKSRSSPVEISTVYACAGYTKQNAVETTDDYSLVNAVGSRDKTEDDSSKLIYSEVDLSKGAAASLSSAPHGDANNVIYSVPREAASSNGRPAEGDSVPLYSTVSLP